MVILSINQIANEIVEKKKKKRKEHICTKKGCKTFVGLKAISK